MLLLNGRSEYVEKNDETAADLNKRGFDVFSFDWRGQGLSARMLPNRQKGFVETYADYLGDLDGFIRAVMVPNAIAPFYLLAHSLGGHVGLRYLHDHPGLFKRAVLTAPLIDIAMPSVLKNALRVYARWAVKLGFGENYVPGAGDHKPPRFENNKLTSDRGRFERMKRQLLETPGLALGGVTHQWLWATFRSIDRLCAKGFIENMETPTLMVAAQNDRIVSLAAQKAMQKRMPQCQLVTLENARHEILVEADEIRNRFWKIFDAFLK
ncbi:MAG: alpha/beta hydrolase [Thermodesulfobacteriota bacterium]